MTEPTIIPARDCSAEWLARTLPCLLFGGEYAVWWDSRLREPTPVYYDPQGRVRRWRA